MYVAGADDPFTWALSRFHAEARAAEDEAERGYHRALIDWAMDRTTFQEMNDAADVALAHTAARLIRAMGEVARSCEGPPAPHYRRGGRLTELSLLPRCGAQRHRLR